MVTKQSQEELSRSLRDIKRKPGQARTCTYKLYEIIRQLYEDNIYGKIIDERFSLMIASYDEEHHTPESRVTALKYLIASEKERGANVDSFLAIVRKYTDNREPTAEIIREFVDKVCVLRTERVGGCKVRRIRIEWNCIGEFDPPVTKGQK